jgi:hypothetical protein
LKHVTRSFEVRVKTIFKFITLFLVGVLTLSNCVERKGWRGHPFLHAGGVQLMPRTHAFDNQFVLNQAVSTLELSYEKP